MAVNSDTKSTLRCSVVIATLDRVASLGVVLECLRRQTRPPAELIICAAGDGAAAALAAAFPAPFPIRCVPAAERSAACQRNQAAALATGEILAFLDDDIEFAEDLFARMLARFEDAGLRPGALGPRIRNYDRRAPGWITRQYYRLQAGYAHADYGGRLFGPAINCVPVYGANSPALIPAQWLPGTCLFMPAEIFRRYRFPEFTGYSYAEDVHLTARVAREAPLYFVADCGIVHHSLPSEFKADRARLVAGKLRNLHLIARDILGLRGWALWWRWQLHRLFLTAALLARRPPQWIAELRGIWFPPS